MVALGVSEKVRKILDSTKQKDLNEALDHAFFYVKRIREKHLGIKTDKGFIRIPHNQIVYIESYNRAFLVHDAKAQIYRSLSLRSSFESTLESILADARFVQNHKSFIVNIGSIKKIQAQKLILVDGTSLPIAQSRYGRVKEAYQRYFGFES